MIEWCIRLRGGHYPVKIRAAGYEVLPGGAVLFRDSDGVSIALYGPAAYEVIRRWAPYDRELGDYGKSAA